VIARKPYDTHMHCMLKRAETAHVTGPPQAAKCAGVHFCGAQWLR
jgi:hypothetical protein